MMTPAELMADGIRQALKAERARVRRIVKKVLKEAQEDHFGEVLLGHELACDDLLTALKGRG